MQGQGPRASGGRGGGRGRGGGVTMGRAGGSRDYQQDKEGRGWLPVGRGGSTRPRNVSRSPPDRRGPPDKRVDKRASPKADTRGNSPLLIELSPNRFIMPGGVEEEEQDDEEEEGVDDVEEMF